MRSLSESWLLLSDEQEVAEHTTSRCTLPTNRLLVAFNSESNIANIAQAYSMAPILPRCQPVTSRDICADTKSVVASVVPTCAAMSLVAASQVPRQVSVRAAGCLLPAVVDGHQVPELTITSSEFGSAHSLPISPQSLNDLRKLAVALSKVSRDTWQKYP